MTLSRLGSSVCNVIASIDWANDKHVIMCYKTEGIDCMQKLHPDSVHHAAFCQINKLPPPPKVVVELWDSNSHVTQEQMEREWKESKLGDRDCQSCQRLPCLQFTVIKLC